MPLKQISPKIIGRLDRTAKRGGDAYVSQAKERLARENPNIMQYLEELSTPDCEVVEDGLYVYEILRLFLGKAMPAVRKETLEGLLENLGSESEQEVIEVSDDKVSDMEKYATQLLKNKYIRLLKEEQPEIYESVWQFHADPILLFNAVEETLTIVIEDMSDTCRPVQIQKEHAKRIMLAAAGVYYLVKTEYEKVPETGLFDRLKNILPWKN